MEKRLKIHNTVSIVTAVLSLITAIIFATLAVVIYKSGGERPYSREIVGSYLKYALIPSILTVASIIAGVVIKFKVPLENSKLKAEIDEYTMLKRLTAKLEKKNSDLLLDKELSEQSALKKKIKIALSAVCSVLGVLALILTITSGYSKTEINASVIKGAVLFISFALVIGALIYAADRFLRIITKREIEIIKNLLSSADGINSSENGEKQTEKEEKSDFYLNIARVSIAVLALIFIVIGSFNGGMAGVLEKAVRICTECIGLG